jgi:hypothetical protein
MIRKKCYQVDLVLPRSGSEPLAEPEPDQKSGSVAVRFAEPNPRFSSRFKEFQNPVNLAEPV